MKILLTVVLLCPVLLSAQALPQGTPAPGTTTGSAIGNAIKTAITTAFPAISTIINAIWPGNANGNKNKTQANAATAMIKDGSTQALQQINSITADLDGVVTFLSSCVVAENNVIALRTETKGLTSVTDAQKLQFKHDWNNAKGPLSKLGSANGTVDKITDVYIRTTFRAMVNANSGLLDNITNEIDQGTQGLGLLSDDLAELDSQLSAVNAMSTEIIGDVSLGLTSVKNAGAGAQGLTKRSPAQQAAYDAMEEVLKQRFPALHR